ncbi:hypothetical protein [Pseudidiomarina insulisalsae]|uniref:MSHA biogenesis protein MshI n=1 Tax=Pseudidiomarina insulisalsae TaxID=575789 RepID=A0A432YNE2_9GAMM|nr:hypothetical protein [Pseudidiomarina insulisalsae]RUO62418.1 hypothetical protein CWI71_02980 [Pseudidiomarina insulisalsae]
MLNLFRARKSSSYTLAFALRKAALHLAVIEAPGDDGEPSLVVNDEVEVKDEDFATAIRNISHNYSRYCRHNPAVSVILSANYYQSVALDRPELEQQELAESLRYSLRDLVAYEPQDCVADYYELPVQVPGQNKINAVAASKMFLTPVMQAIFEISDNVVAVLSEEQAIAELFSDIEEPTVVAYHQPNQPALLQVYRDGTLQVNRAVRSLEKLSELTPDEIKMGGLQPLSVEIQRSGDYFERQLRQRPISEVQLALPLAKQDEVTENLNNDLGLTINWASYPQWARELGAGDYSDFAAIGGALVTLKLQEGDA